MPKHSMAAHGGGNMHGGKHHPAGAKKNGSHYGSQRVAKRSAAKSLNPSAVKKPRGA